MSETRTEVDLLGPKEVPADAYWGVHTQRAVENFPISGRVVSDYPAFVKGLAEVKKAEALANRQTRVLPKKVAKAITQACDKILYEGTARDQFPVDLFQGGAGTSTNMNANEVIANLALEILGLEKGDYDVINPNDHVNKSQSTNDAYPTALRLAVYHMVHDLIKELLTLADTLDHKANQFKRVLKMGRTQLQDAVPMSLGQEFSGFASIIRAECEYLAQQANLLLTVNLGATAIGTGLNTPPGFQPVVVEKLAEVTGLGIEGSANLIAATSDTSDYVAVHSALKRSATKISQICNDLRLLSSGPRAGLNEINLPEMQAGSSIMPAKVNPVIPEVVNQVCFKVFGNDVAVTFASEAGQLELNVMEPVIAQCLFESIEMLQTGSKVLRTKCIEGITANEEICRANVENSIGIVTYLNDIIGHHEGDIVGKECAATGKSVREVVLERGLLSEEQLDEVLSIDNLLKPQFFGQYYDLDD
ncbi:aspartate ammonia-lyase [Actinomyces minihominis]|uniref:aspartate ammonia-lyase n=1 Tax=Actinomyces minihominis TaxID=2002838 RepID=UPI000C084F0B|nr:aspartate ammonia-lyase [Actinomyces minihominis]